MRARRVHLEIADRSNQAGQQTSRGRGPETQGPRPSYFGLGPKTGEKSRVTTTRTGKREGMAPMQWRDATVSETGATGFEAPVSVAARQEPDVRQVFDQVSIMAVASSAAALPVGLDLSLIHI